MKLQKTGYLIILLILLSVGSLKAQDLAFSQFYHTPFLTNPALLVKDHQMRIFLNFRNQSIGAGDNLSTPMASLVYPFGLRKGATPKLGFGFSFINDNAAELLTTNGLIFSGVYHQKLGSQILISLGALGGIFQRRIAIEKITTDNQYLLGFFNPDAGINEDLFNTSAVYLTASLGAAFTLKDVFERDKLTFGLSFNHFNEPQVALFKENSSSTQTIIPRNITFTGSFYHYPHDRITWMPSFRWIYRLNTHLLNLGSMVKFSFSSDRNLLKNGDVHVGLWYNTNKALVTAFEFHQPRYWIALSYDLSIGLKKQTFSNQGVFEMTLGLKIPRKIKPDVPLEDTLAPPPNTLVKLPIRDSLIQENLYDLFMSQNLKPKRLPEEYFRNLENDEPTSFSPQLDTVLIKVRRIEKNKPDTLIIQSLKQIGFILSKEDKTILNKKVRFDLNSDTFSGEYRRNLDEIAEVLQKNKTMHLLIVGHTCNVGDATENQELSLTRALAVKEYLIQKGVNPERLKVKGMGASFPLVPNDSEYNRNINRRVEFKVIPNSE